MENGNLKIKEGGKVNLKVGKFDGAPPKEFDFSSLSIGNYPCEVERLGGAIARIIVNGKEIPKDAAKLQQKEDAAEKRKAAEEEERKRQIEERQKEQNQVQNHNFGGGGQPPRREDDSFSNGSNDNGEPYFRVPRDTRDLKIKSTDAENFALKFYRFARFEAEFDKKSNDWKHKFSFYKKGYFKIGVSNFGNLPIEESSNTPLSISTRQTESAKAIYKDNLIESSFSPAWRMVVGLGGGASVYETGMTLHHIYGIPYIPASAVKGVLRSYIIQTIFDNDERNALKGKDKTEEEKEKSRQFCQIFGCPSESILGKDHQGNVVFFDAFPTAKPKLQPDVMNPHYPEYYGRTKPPTDTQNPVPIFFLTVYDTPFQFLMASKNTNFINDELNWERSEDKKKFTLKNWLKEALSEKGIGAKTAVGYGYMK